MKFQKSFSKRVINFKRKYLENVEPGRSLAGGINPIMSFEAESPLTKLTNIE